MGGDELHRAIAEKQDVVSGKSRQLTQFLRAEAERFAVADLSLLQPWTIWVSTAWLTEGVMANLPQPSLAAQADKLHQLLDLSVVVVRR